MDKFIEKMKKPRLLLLLLVFLAIVFVFVIIVLKPFTKEEKLTETNTNVVTITQAYVSVSVFGGDTTNDSKPDIAVLLYSPLVNFTTTKDISKFEIKNVKLTNEIDGKGSFITWPKHYKYGQDSNYYYEPMGQEVNYASRQDEGSSFEYKVVEVSQYSDEMGKRGGYVDFRYTVFGLGNPIDYEGIMKSQQIYSGGKELQYAGLKQGDVNSPIEFDVVFTFTDDTKAIKHFSLTTNFEELYNQGFSFEYNSSDYEGKTF